MINALDAMAYENTQNRLAQLSPSSRSLRMADGSLVASLGVWSGTLEWGQAKCTTSFEVFPSGGSWRMLLGKPLLEQLRAVQDYGDNTICIKTNGVDEVFHSFTQIPVGIALLPCPTMVATPVATVVYNIPANKDTEGKPLEQPHPLNNHGDVSTSIMQPNSDTVFTRLTNEGPFYPPRIQKILDTVVVGPLPEAERAQVHNLIAEFADIFALLVQEVKPVDFVKFWLNIPKDKEYPIKVHQRPLMQAQKEWYYPVLDNFVAAGVLREIRPDEVKAAHLTVLAQKAHGALGLTIDEIKWRVEDKCRCLGEKPNPNMPP